MSDKDKKKEIICIEKIHKFINVLTDECKEQFCHDKIGYIANKLCHNSCYERKIKLLY